MSNTFESVYNHPIFNHVLDSLTLNAFLRENNMSKDLVIIKFEDLHRSAWLATILSNSEEERHLNKALSFAILAYLDNKEDIRFEQLCYIIQSRTGHIPTSMHLKKILDENEKFKSSFGTILDIEMGINRADSKMKIGDQDIFATKFQLQLMDILNQKKHIAISAPTSSGKSFIIQGYIINNIKKQHGFRAIYIVPTRALIYQVTRQLREKLEDKSISIKNALGESDVDTSPTREILVLTPERSLKLLDSSVPENYNPDLIFFDEIQNIEDETRGVLLEYVLRELHLKWKMSQIVVAGPFINDLPSLLQKTCNIESTSTKTVTSPVLQLKTVLQAKSGNKKIRVTILSPSGNKISTKILLSKSIYSRLKSNIGEALAVLISELGQNSNNIIYSHRKDTAEIWADKISAVINQNYTAEHTEIKELVDYLSAEIHPKYSLIQCLQNRVGFHHGSVPDIARSEIEELYSNGSLTNIVCTSTLLEGVNLPAQKLFIAKAKIGTDDMENFDFGNLLGRTGRMNYSIYGSIYCLEVEDDPWTEEKIDSGFGKEIIPATTYALTENLTDLINDILINPLDIETKSIAYTICLLRHKFLNSIEELNYFLETKDISKDHIATIKDNLKNSVNNIKVPNRITRLNPTIDPILQDELYKSIGNDGINNWLINKVPFRQIKLDINTQRRMGFIDREFYGQFEYIAERLNGIFGIEMETRTKHMLFPSQSIRQMTRDAFMWLRGNSYRTIIENELKNKKVKENDYKEINKYIRSVTNTINQNVTFRLVKYFKLWSDILKEFMDEEELENNKYILSLPNMLELGADNPIALKLISEGLSRSVALAIAKEIPANIDEPIKEWLQKNPPQNLSPLYYKHLVRRGYI